ncbi:MAG: hypothetical protein ACI4D3_10855 [Lachnospiraceae bacterium]
MTDEQLDSMWESLGLNGNAVQRYANWAKKMLQGDWGLSVSNHHQRNLVSGDIAACILVWNHDDYPVFAEAGMVSKLRNAYNRR